MTVTWTASPSAATGEYQLWVLRNNPASYPIMSLYVLPATGPTPDYTLTMTPVAQSGQRPNSGYNYVSYSVTATAINGFGGTISLSQSFVGCNGTLLSPYVGISTIY